MPPRLQTSGSFCLVSSTSGRTLEIGGGGPRLRPPLRPTPAWQRWSLRRGVLVNGNGQRLVQQDGILAATRGSGGTALHLDEQGVLRVGQDGPEVHESTEHHELMVREKRGKKPLTTFRAVPVETRRFNPPATDEEQERRDLWDEASEGDARAQKDFARLFRQVDPGEVRIRHGEREVTLGELLGRLDRWMTLDLVHPFAAPLLWDLSRARLLVADCAERTVNAFEESSYGKGQGVRAIAVARGLVSGEAGEEERAEAQQAADEVEPWDHVKQALSACRQSISIPEEFEPTWALQSAQEVRQILPSSLDEGMSDEQAVAAEQAWQAGRLWGYLTGAIPCLQPSLERRHLLAAQRQLARAQGLRQALLARDKPLRQALAEATASKNKEAVKVLRQALALLR